MAIAGDRKFQQYKTLLLNTGDRLFEIKPNCDRV